LQSAEEEATAADKGESGGRKKRGHNTRVISDGKKKIQSL
jgi:hypothetical protein